MDEEVIGFGLKVRETGRKSFTLDGAGGSTSAISPIGRLGRTLKLTRRDLDQGLAIRS
jgi:hypothetical protein